MASESDSLFASSSTGMESVTPITSSSDQGSTAPAPASGTYKINMLRRKSGSRSTPVAPVVTVLNIEQPVSGKAKAKSKAQAKPKSPIIRTASPKRTLEEYKPTVSMDSGGFFIFYDPRGRGSQWRNVMNGMFAKAPPEHQL